MSETLATSSTEEQVILWQTGRVDVARSAAQGPVSGLGLEQDSPGLHDGTFCRMLQCGLWEPHEATE